ncbi:hypothetical protein SOVF_216320 [Spinacia oleracea]|nr:hypothetical protein SOVF_216320 [Spinacia oleracea]
MSDVFQALSVGCTNEPLLEYLDLSMNQFWGSVPNMISSFSSMRELDLNGNHLNGSISQGIGKLSMLEVLDVSYNSIRDTLNHNHFLNLSNLRELYLSDNHALMVNLSAGWVPPFKLNIISLRSCKLGPSFPDWLLTQTNFSYLDISDTQLSDKIPASFWAKSLSSNLQFLNASHNKIHGVLPNLSATFDIDSVIDLSSNYFEGSIPSFLGTYASSLYLNDNMFSDATHLLCPRIGNTVLWDLDLSNNLLSGKLPDCWMKFDQLQYLHLENNKFSGNIPTSIGDLKQLNYLHLQNNSFSGDLPARLENCTSLLILDLGYNSLTGYIPPSIGIAFNDLRLLNLRGNHFFGRLPLSLCQLSNLHLLDLAINHISGTIPDCIHNLTAMIKGGSDYLVSVSTSLGKEAISPYEETAVIEWKREQQKFKDTLAQVNYIDLSSNELEGEIPDGITNLTGLISLDLSRNKLRGSIVSNIGQLILLEFLDLSNNHLSGVIPTSLADVSYLGTLDLSNNNLSGKIPLGTQLQGFDPSSYKGNPLLCGAPLRKCPGDKPPNGESMIHQEEHGNDDIYPGLYISVVLGFIIGFWGVCGTLVMKTSWRHAFFRLFDGMKDKVYVMVVVNIARA